MKASEKPKIKGVQYYKIGDKVEAIKTNLGAWFTADIIDILHDSKCECKDEECQFTYKLLFESEGDNDVEVVDRKLSEIRQVSFSSISWDKLTVGMRVVINYNVDKPKEWGYWYDYIIEDIQKRQDVYFLNGTLLVGYDGSSQKLPVSINSDNVADILEIRPHATLDEKEMDSYETGVKPEYCSKCRNKPKVRCKECCCCKCGMKTDFELTVQCDECGDWYHIYCINPPVKELPEDQDWYCPNCNNEAHRAKLEMKLMLKKQKKYMHNVKKHSVKTRNRTQRTLKIIEKSSKNIEAVPDAKQDHYDEDSEMKGETKKVLDDSKIWNQVKKLFPEYDIIRVTAEVTKKKMFGGIISSAAEEYINNDVVNKHLWEEAKRSVVNGKQAFLETVRKIFTCAICLELLSDPITLSCKHSFCIDCFFRSLSVNVYNCTLCRVEIKHTEHYGINENLSNALTLLFRPNSNQKIHD